MLNYLYLSLLFLGTGLLTGTFGQSGGTPFILIAVLSGSLFLVLLNIKYRLRERWAAYS